ncbi:hypothetical protein DFH11DRAFT_1764888, partial [Phellopilus nigrolimitatus]
MPSTPRLSSDSASSLSSDSRSSRRSPGLGLRSTSALILVHERDDEDNAFAFSDEDSESLVEDNSPPELIIPPSIAFGYFLAPCLKLGAMLILSSQAPLKISLPALLVFSFLSVFSRQVWFLLARYVRKSDVADIVAEAVSRNRDKDRLKSFVRSATRFGSGTVRILLATVYIKGAKSSLEPLWPDAVSPVPPSTVLSVVFMIFLVPLSLGPSLASRRLVYSTGVSNALYIVWLCAIIYAHAEGSLNTDNVMIAQGRLFQDISAVAFAFSSLSTLHLYSGMVGLRASSDKKEKRYLSISSISFSAALLGTAMVLPLLFPSVKSHGNNEPTTDPPLVQALIATLTAFILVLAIPPLLATSPHLPIPLALRRLTSRPLGKHALLLVLFLLSLLPAAAEPVLEDAVVLLVLLGTYFLPALLHIILHNMRRPLSILVTPRSQPLPARWLRLERLGGPPDRDPDTEELLLRKERALQRRRLGRRIMWDLGVWTLLIPVGGGGMAWAVGRFAGAW